MNASSFSPLVDFCNFHTNAEFENMERFTRMMSKSIAHNAEYLIEHRDSMEGALESQS